MYKTVILSDGDTCRVRVLGLFELDGKSREVPGPYRYSLLLATGQVVEDEFDIRAFDEPPRPPDMPIEDIKPGTWEWNQLQQAETYQAALAYEKVRLEAYEGYINDIAAYILANCLEESDRARVITAGDWETVYRTALVPQLTQEVIAATLADTFPGLVWQVGDTTGVSGGGTRAGDGGGAEAVGD